MMATMKYIAFVLLAVTCVLGSLASTKDALDLTIRPTLKEPAVTLKDAITLAEAFVATNRISTNGFWMKEVKLIYPDGKDIASKCWHVLWVNEDAALGHTISIMIDMNRKVSRMGSL